MWHLFSIQGSKTQTLLESTIIRCINLLIKRFVNIFCNEISNFRSIERWDLRLYFSNREPPTKMIHCEPVKTTINALSLWEVIINVMVRHYDLANSFISNYGSVFIIKFWSSLSYFIKIKKRLLIVFHSQINEQIERQNSTMEPYLHVFLNYEQDY